MEIVEMKNMTTKIKITLGGLNSRHIWCSKEIINLKTNQITENDPIGITEAIKAEKIIRALGTTETIAKGLTFMSSETWKEWLKNGILKKNLLRTMTLKIPVLMKDKCTDLKNLNKSQRR